MKIKRILLISALVVFAALIMVLCACSEEDGTLAVKFNSMGGSKVDLKEIQKGSKIPKPDDPTRPGYTFLGWYYKDEPWDWDTKIKSSMELKAKWSLNTYTATFYDHEGTFLKAITFTVEDGETLSSKEEIKNQIPAITPMPGYDGAWDDLTIKPQDLEIHLQYTLHVYKVYLRLVRNQTTTTIIEYTCLDDTITLEVLNDVELENGGTAQFYGWWHGINTSTFTEREKVTEIPAGSTKDFYLTAVWSDDYNLISHIFSYKEYAFMMTPAEKKEFQKSFPSTEEFNAWRVAAKKEYDATRFEEIEGNDQEQDMS